MRRLAALIAALAQLPGCDAVASVLDSFDQPSTEQLAQLSDVFDCDVRAITNSGSRDGSLAGGDCQLGDGSLVDLYAFRISSETDLRVTMTAPSFSPYVLLYDERAFVLNQDGAPPGDDTTELTFRVNEGLFVVGANSVEPGATGGYTLTVERR